MSQAGRSRSRHNVLSEGAEDEGSKPSSSGSNRPGSKSSGSLSRGDSSSSMLKRGESKGSLKSKLKKQDSGGEMSMLPDMIGEEGVSNAVMKRIEVARKSGKLDLAGMSLAHIPNVAMDLGESARVVWLQDNELAEIPKSIHQWAVVTQLKLGNNKIQSIPEEIGKCVALSMLLIHDNHLVHIPDTITHCKALSILDIRNNRMVRIPVFLALLPQLTDLQVDNNPLEFPHKRVVSQGKMNLLKYLRRFTDARRTRKLNLTGVGQYELPPEVAYIGERLVEIDASDLYKQGGISLPFELGSCPNLAVCKLSPTLEILSPPESVSKLGIRAIVEYLARFRKSQTEGRLDLRGLELEDLPPEINDTKQLEPKLVKTFIITDNKIQALSTGLGMMQNLEELHAGGNTIRTLPASLAKLKALRLLDADRNMISEVSHQVCFIPELVELRLRGNKIITFSENFSDVPKLVLFDLGENLLDKIPSFLPGCLANLKTLLLDGNKLYVLPKEIGKMKSLQLLDIKGNGLKSLPQEIGQLQSLQTLVLTDNSLKGIPDTVGMLTSLKELHLRGNPALKVLPMLLTDIARFRCPLVLGEPSLDVLEIDAEVFNSPPAAVAVLGIEAIYEYLSLLRFSEKTNAFVYSARQLKEVPDPIFGIENLTHLDLSDNLLEVLPEKLAALGNIATLNLDGNHFSLLPPPILELTNLTCLSLLRNPLVKLPVGLGNLHSLATLDIGIPGPSLSVPPPEISRKGGTSVMTYLRRITSAASSSRLEMARLGLHDLYPEIVDACFKVSRMSLAHNNLRSLPGWIGRCHSLSTLMLHSNMLSSIPSDMTKLKNLRCLDVEGNRFEEVPEVLTSLTNLRELRMSRNEISGCPLVLCSLPLLIELVMDHNKISALPNRIGRCAKLVHISFGSNELTKLPESMKDLTCLTSMNMANNRLKIIPPEAGLLPQLEYADFAGNDLESPPMQVIDMGTAAIADFLSKVKTMLETGYVDLSDTNLNQIPMDVLSYDAISTIVVSRNALEELSGRIGNLRHLRLLDISFNKIKVLPPELGKCLSLEELYAAQNLFDRVPIEYAKLTKLEVLDLDHEKVLSPPELVTTSSGSEVVRYLNGLDSGAVHSSSDFSGFGLPYIPQEVMVMVSIKTLRLSDNALESPFPPAIARFTRLERLSLDRNPRIRDLPKTMRLMTSLTELTLGGNEYKSVPEEVYRLTNLTLLDLSNNELEGLGAIMGNLSRLITLNLGHNKMWTLPWNAMVKMGNLKTLQLEGNPVSYISAAIGQLTSLTLLDLSDSSLLALPVETADLSTLTDLRLENVAIESPSTVVCAKGIDEIFGFMNKVRKSRNTTFLSLIECECDGGRDVGIDHYYLGSVLQSLDISLSSVDVISQPILALESLTYLNISRNKLKKLPEAIGTSYPFLETLDASDNLMTFLPRSFGGLTSLADLDLAKNMLETLPPSISMCTRLTHLDLEDNQVTFLPREAVSLRRLSRLDMPFRFLTDLQNLGLNWNMWGKPPPDVVLQGGKVVPRFYKELITAAGMLEGKLNTGPKSVLNLSNFGLLQMPTQICEKGFFTHLQTLNLERNNLTEIGAEVSKLTALRTIQLKGNPIKRLTPSLGALPYIHISCAMDKIENVPENWLQKGESGVVTYLHKAYTEISVGCIDFSSSGIQRLPQDVSDYLLVQELFLIDNKIDRLPAAIGTLTNLKTLQAQQNRLASLPREISLLSSLKKLTLEGNIIRILPTELGLMHGLQHLGYHPETFPGVPKEIIEAGKERMFDFLFKLEEAKGVQRLVQPLPGLKHGDEFTVNIEGQEFTITVPYTVDLQSREKFIRYFPVVSSASRAIAVAEGFTCLSKNNVGNTLDLSDMGLEKWHFYCASGYSLDAAQDNFLDAMKDFKINPKRKDPGAEESLEKPMPKALQFMGSSMKSMGSMIRTSSQGGGTEKDFLDGDFDDGYEEYEEEELDDRGDATGVMIKKGRVKVSNDPRDGLQYIQDHDGYVRASAVKVHADGGGGGLAMFGNLMKGGLGGLLGGGGAEEQQDEENSEDEEDSEDEEGIARKKKAKEELTRAMETTKVERPLMTCDRPDPFFCIMTDTSFRECVPLAVCAASNLTTLNLDNNRLSTIGPSIGYLSSLTHLSARHNAIEAISWRLRFLQYLRELDVSNNRLAKLPTKIGRCFRLQILDVSNNRIVALPATIGRLENLKLINCSNNPILHLPHEIGGVDDEEHSKDIVGLRSIRSIILRDCDQLSQLPSKLFRLTTLTELDVEGSPNIITPPPEIMKKDMPGIREFFQWLYDAENGDTASFVGQGLYHAPLALAQITRQVSETQPRLEYGLKSLKHLDLCNNMIRELDPFLADLTNLRSLKADGNRLDRLPEFFKYYTRLGYLSISHNKITMFPPETGAMLSVRTIIAHNNEIDSLVDGFARLSTLRNLELSHNKFRTVPECLLRLSELRTLRLDHNELLRVPKNIAGLQGLHTFTISTNKLKELPNEIGDLLALQTLEASDNEIEYLPVGVGKLSNLVNLDIRRNGCLRPPKGTQEKGPVAVVEYLERIAQAEKRKLLDLSGFGLGTFPTDVGLLTSLTELNLTDNSILSVPADVVNLTRIVVLRLAKNGVKKLSAVVGSLTTIETLDLHDNNLDSLPPTFHKLVNLLHLNLSGNKISIFPAELEKLTQLQHIDLTDNEMTRIPTWMGSFSTTNAILLGGNMIQTIPNSVGGMGPLVLKVINMSNNGLIKVPTALCGVGTLERLTFTGNQLTDLPAQIGRLARLEELWLDSNKLQRLPPSLGSWVSLTALYVHNNKLQGLPRAIVELGRLTVLTLSNNEIKDLPWNLPILSNLQELWLDSNQISLLPQGLEEMPRLKDFTCKYNEFEGKELERAEALMERFENEEVSHILAMKALADKPHTPPRREAKVEAITTAEEAREAERAKLQQELKEAQDAGDFEKMEALQSQIDVFDEDDAHHDAGHDGYADDDQDEEAGAVMGVILTVTVIGCDDLVPHKGNFVDAYVELTADATKQKTKVQRKTTAPIFNETFTFKGSDRKSLGLSIEVKHHNMISADVVLGKCEIANSKYPFGREAIETVSMYKTAVGMDDAGSIDVKYRLDRVK